MAFSLRNIGTKILDLIGGTNIQAGQRSIQDANNILLQNRPLSQPGYGVLAANPAARQQFAQSQGMRVSPNYLPDANSYIHDQNVMRQAIAQRNLGLLTPTQARGSFLSKTQGAVPDFSANFRPSNPVQVAGMNVINAANQRQVAPLALGVARSAVGTGEGLTGLYDLAPPGKGNNRFGQQLRKAGESTDRTVAEQGFNKNLYHGAQVATDLATFAAAGAPSVKGVAGAETLIGKVPGVGRVVAGLDKVSDASAIGNLGVRTGKFLARPGVAADVLTDAALATGLRANRGKDVSAASILGSAAQSAGTAIGLKGAGKVLGAAGAPVVRALQNVNVSPATAAKRISVKEQNLLRDYTSMMTGEYRPNPRARSDLITQVREIGKKHDVDLITGSRMDLADRAAELLDQVGKPRVGLKRLALDEGGGMNAPRNQAEADAMFGDRGRFSGRRPKQTEDVQIKALLAERKKAMNAGQSEYAYAAEQKLKQLGYNVDAPPTKPKVALKQAAPADLPPTTPAPAQSLSDSLPNTTRKPGYRGNIEKVLKGNPTAETVVEFITEGRRIKNKNTLKRAADAVAANPEREFANLITKQQLTSADDVAKGHLLLRDAIERGDTETAIQLGSKMNVDGRKLGQAIQAYSLFKRTTPEGVIKYASKQAQAAGKALDPEMASSLMEQAKRLANMPEGLEKAKLRRDMLKQAESAGNNWVKTANNILSTPRAAMATADLSAPLRQGAVLGSRFPKEFSKNAAESVEYMARPGVFEQAMYDITQRPNYSLYKSHGLAVDAATDLSGGSEELFMSSILEGKVAKKLGVGHVVAASDRAYSGFLTKFRADVFDKIVAESDAAGVKLGKAELDSLAKFINSASGRGDGNITRQVSKLQVLFSPRLWKSRLDTFNPVYIARLKGPARKYALQSAGSFLSAVTTVLGLAALAGADVETDPRSSDFAKIKVGNTRYDILGGHQQNIRLIAQMVTGEKINSTTGKLETLGPDRGFGKPSRKDLLYQFIENKENPLIAFGTKVLSGKDASGEKVNVATEAGKLFVPLNLQGTYETSVDQGSLAKGVAMNIPGTFGVGVQTYGGDKKGKQGSGTVSAATGAGSIEETKASEAEVLAAMKKNKSDGYDIQLLSNGRYAAQIGTNVSSYDSKKEAQKAIAKDAFKKSDTKSKLIGDTFYYKTKDGTIKTQPKVMYEVQRDSAKNKLEMDRAVASKDTDKWLTFADKELENLLKKQGTYDPDTEQEEIDKVQLQIENLVDKAAGYLTKGIGGKYASSGSSGGRIRSAASGRSGSGGGGGGSSRMSATDINPMQYAVSLNAGGSVPKPRVSVKAAGRPTTRKAARRAAPKVSLKRSRV